MVSLDAIRNVEGVGRQTVLLGLSTAGYRISNKLCEMVIMATDLGEDSALPRSAGLCSQAAHIVQVGE